MKQEDINTILGESQIKNSEEWEGKSPCDNCIDDCIDSFDMCKHYIKPKESKMKPQFTEEDKWFCYSCNSEEPCIFVNPATQEKPEGCLLQISGAIWSKGKSDLEILIEEAESIYEAWSSGEVIDRYFIISKQRDCIQAMKAEIEKLKKS